MAIGYGYDLHTFRAGSKAINAATNATADTTNEIMLGGVSIPCNKQIVAHSDGDVLLHAVCDALLGAAGLGDLGEHFPDTDDKWLNLAGAKLVKLTMEKIKHSNYRVLNLDSTIILEKPGLTPYKSKMRANLAILLETDISAINIKATRNEGMDAIGRGEAIAAHCVCLLQTINL